MAFEIGLDIKKKITQPLKVEELTFEVRKQRVMSDWHPLRHGRGAVRDKDRA